MTSGKFRPAGVCLVAVLAACSPAAPGAGQGGSHPSNAVVASAGSGAPTGRAQIAGLKHPFWVALGEGSVWVTEYEAGNLVRIDPQTNRVMASIHVGGHASQFVIEGGSAWVVDDLARGITRVDTRSNLVVKKTSLQEPGGLTLMPSGIAIGEGSIWVTLLSTSAPARGDLDELARIDPGTDLVLARISIHGFLSGVVVGGGAVWVATLPLLDPSSVDRIDPATNRVVAKVDTGHNISGALAYGEQALWVANDDGYLTRIDTRSNQVVGSFEVGSPEWPAMVAAPGALWISAPLDNIVARFDPQINEVSKTVATGNRPQGLALGAGVLWVTNYLDGTLVKLPMP